jgi:hypothetical protein
MPKWKEDTKEFKVGIRYDRVRGASCTIPKPIIVRLGAPQKLIFIIKGSRIEVQAASNFPDI